MEIHRNMPLSLHTTFRMGGIASYFCEVNTEDELSEALAFAEAQQLPVWVLGGGSNILVPDSREIQAIVIKITIGGFTVASDGITVSVGAGENWDNFVGRTVALGLSGLEALSAIPGTVGGTPVQNVGAYGQEVKNVITNVRAYDRKDKQYVQFSNEECHFTYRDSLFKHEGKNRYIITQVTFRLSKNPPIVPNYPGVTAYFQEQHIVDPTLIQIRESITAIRSHKLPDPKEIASVGSFFKNPIVANEKAEEIKKQYERAVIFPVGEGKSKIGAGWLIETLGLKGKTFGQLGFYEHNALVIVNRGTATYEELMELVSMVQKKAQDQFGILLEPEPIVFSL